MTRSKRFVCASGRHSRSFRWSRAGKNPEAKPPESRFAMHAWLDVGARHRPVFHRLMNRSLANAQERFKGLSGRLLRAARNKGRGTDFGQIGFRTAGWAERPLVLSTQSD